MWARAAYAFTSGSFWAKVKWSKKKFRSEKRNKAELPNLRAQPRGPRASIFFLSFNHFCHTYNFVFFFYLSTTTSHTFNQEELQFDFSPVCITGKLNCSHPKKRRKKNSAGKTCLQLKGYNVSKKEKKKKQKIYPKNSSNFINENIHITKCIKKECPSQHSPIEKILATENPARKSQILNLSEILMDSIWSGIYWLKVNMESLNGILVEKIFTYFFLSEAIRK